VTQHKLLPKEYLINLTTALRYLSTHRRQCDWTHPVCHRSRTLISQQAYAVEFMHRRLQSFRRGDYATLYSNVTRANASWPCFAEESNREWTYDSTREISIVRYNARWLVISVRSRGGDLYGLENGRICYHSRIVVAVRIGLKMNYRCYA